MTYFLLRAYSILPKKELLLSLWPLGTVNPVHLATILSYPMLSYTILSYPILSYPIQYDIRYTICDLRYTIYDILYTIQYILYTICYILYTIHYTLYYTILYYTILYSTILKLSRVECAREGVLAAALARSSFRNLGAFKTLTIQMNHEHIAHTADDRNPI